MSIKGGNNLVDVWKVVLDIVLKKIEKNFGKGVIMWMGDVVQMIILMILSGLLVLDDVLGVGGYLCGWIVEIYGFESLGKMIVVLYVVVEV